MVKNPPATWNIWVWSVGWEDPLEKGMATPYSILAWGIPWTEEPGRLQSTGSQRVGHDWMSFISPHGKPHAVFSFAIPLTFLLSVQVAPRGTGRQNEKPPTPPPPPSCHHFCCVSSHSSPFIHPRRWLRKLLFLGVFMNVLPSKSSDLFSSYSLLTSATYSCFHRGYQWPVVKLIDLTFQIATWQHLTCLGSIWHGGHSLSLILDMATFLGCVFPPVSPSTASLNLVCLPLKCLSSPRFYQILLLSLALFLDKTSLYPWLDDHLKVNCF